MARSGPTTVGNVIPLNYMLPTQLGTTSWSKVSAGTSYSVGIKSDNTLFTWGLNSTGQLGIGDTINRSSPIQLSATGISNFSAITAGLDHVAAITTDGRLYTWGNSTAVNTYSVIQSWTQISYGGTHTLAIRNDGILFAWGNNAVGQIGDGTTVNKSSPVQLGTTSWTEVSAGTSHSLAITSTGTLFAWGLNNAGQLGTTDVNAAGDTLNRSSPAQIGAGSWVDVSASLSHSTAIDSTGKLFAWGLNNAGQLGDTTTLNRSSPVQISAGISWSVVSGGSSFTAGVASTGALYTWGLNSVNQLGNQTTINRSAPTQLDTNSWTTVSAGTSHTLAIRTNSTLWTWGQNTAINVVVEPLSWTTISASQSHSLAIKSDGSLWAWGTNTNGQIGTTDTLNRSMPVLVNGLSSFSVVYAGPNTSYAIRTDGKLFTWGLNTSYQMGDGSAVNKSSPVLINSNMEWSKISGGVSHAIAITTSNYLWGWGLQTQGQLGTNTTNTKPAPMQLSTLSTPTDATGISAITKIGDPILCHHSALSTGAYNPATFGGSAYFSGLTTDAYSLPHSASLDLTSGDFTIECWMYLSDITNGRYIFNKSGATGTNVAAYAILVRASGASLDFQTQNSNGATAGQQFSFGTLGTNILINTWYHLAVTRSGTTISTYRDGTRITSTTQTVAIVDRAAVFTIGHQINGTGAASGAFAGYISNLRIVKGVAVYTGTSFTPPTAQLATTQSANTNGNPSAAITAGQTTLLTLQGIGTPTSWSQVSANSSHSIAINSAGNLFGWGFNASYQIGDNTTITKSSPVQITSGINTSFTAISAGFDHNLALSTTNKLYAWGSSTAISYQNQILSWTRIASGTGHTAAIRSDGLLFTWGNNSAGQLGIADTINRSSPVLLGNPNQGTILSNSWTTVDAGGSTTVAVRSDGTLWAWGLGTSGELGYGTAANRSSPVQIGANTNWSFVIVGTNHSIATTNVNTAFTWGLNTSGQLGINNAISRSSPVQVTTTLAASWISVSAGTDHTLGVASTGVLYGWGNNNVNQAGLYGADVPYQIASTMNNTFTSIEHGGHIRRNGTLFMWGSNGSGQLGNGTTIDRSSPVQVAGSWNQIASAAFLTHGIKSDGTLWSWGSNGWGQLGTNNGITYSSPVQVAGGGTWNFVNTFVDSTTNTNLVYGIKSDGTLWSWGGNGASGFFGDGSPAAVAGQSRSSPVQVGLLSTWSMISGQVGIRTDGTMWSWGLNTLGTVGDGTTTAKSSMVQIGAGSSWIHVNGGASGFFVSGTGTSYFAINTLGELYAWGNNSAYELGLNDTINRSNPTKVGSSSWVAVCNGGSKSMGLDVFGRLYIWGRPTTAADTGFAGISVLSQPVQIAAGTSFVAIPSKFNSAKMASATTGGFFTWGFGGSGILATNTAIDRSSPTLIAAAPALTGSIVSTSASAPTQVFVTPFSTIQGSWLSVSAGQSHSVAIMADRKLYAWGLNTIGQLGDISTVNRTSYAVQIPNSWSQIYAGVSITSALNNNSGLFTWGLGTSGELGTTTAINRSIPTQVGTSSFTVINAGTAVGAIYTNNTAVVFGLNATGQLGTVDALNRSSPTLVGTGGLKTTTFFPVKIDDGENSWTAIAAGQSHSAAIRATTGSLWAWGLGASGQLGQNNAATYSSPIQIGTSSWSSVAAGSSFTLAVRNDNLLYAWGLGGTGQTGLNITISYSSPVLVGQFGQGINNNTMSPVQIGVSQGIATSWSKISAGNSASMAVRTVGELYVWGLGTSGQLGFNSATSRSSPTQIAAAAPVDASINSFAISAYGSPTRVLNVSPFAGGAYNSAIYGGSYFLNSIHDYFLLPTLGVCDFGVNTAFTFECWLNYTGTLSTNNIFFSTQGTNTPGCLYFNINASGTIVISSWDGATRPNTVVSSINLASNTWYHIVIQRTTLNVYTLYINGIKRAITDGTNNITVLSGIPSVGANPISVTAERIIGYISNLRIVKGVNVYSGTSTSVANFTVPTLPLTATQSADTNIAALGAGVTTLLTFTGLNDPIPSWTQVSSNLSGMAAIRGDSVLHVWGDNASGTLGTNSVTSRSSPVIVQGFNSETRSFIVQIPGSWSSVDAGQSHTAAISSTNMLWAWGLNTSGQIGTTDVVLRSSPAQIGLSSWTSVFATGGQTTYGIKADGLYAWGLGTTGQTTGYMLPISRSSPVQIGNNFLSINQSSPAQIGAGSWSKIGAGISFNTAIKSDGTLYAWGGVATSGQMGDNTTIAKSSPVQISGSWSEVGVGADHVAAIRSDNIMLVWGNNGSGQLGTLDAINRSSPTLLAGSFATTSWNKVASGVSYTLATDTNSLLYTWGVNGSGQLGLNNVITRSSPTQVSTTLSFTSLTGGSTTTGGITSTGLAYNWGVGTVGQLGEFYNLINRSNPMTLGGAYPIANVISPAQIGSSSWRLVSAGNSYSVAIRSDYKLFAWGLNANGQIGINDNINRSSPTQISTKDWNTISAGISHVMGITR